MLYTSITQCKYTITGDSRVYFGEARLIRHGYVKKNVTALLTDLRGGKGEHISLKTEGGFGFLLAASRHVSERAPFLLNGVLVPLALLALMSLAWALCDDKNTAIFSAILFLLLVLLSAYVSKTTWQLTAPLRDALAHLLGILGLGLSVLSFKSEKHRRLKLVVAGALIGLAAWSRVPNILLILPVGVYVVIAPKALGYRAKGGLLLCLGAGLAIGLCPLLIQNILEGRTAFHPEQASLIRTSSAPRGEAPVQIRPGIRFSNLPLLLPRLLAHFHEMCPMWMKVLATVATLAGLWRHFRGTALLLSAAFVFLAFYACYRAVVPRYTIPILWFMWLITALFIASLISALLTLKPWRKWLAFTAPSISVILALTTILLCLQQSKSLSEHRAGWQTTQQFRSWILGNFEREDIFISKGRSIGVWIKYFMDSHNTENYSWRWTVKNTSPRRRVGTERADKWHNHLKQGGRGFFLNEIHPEGAERRSWWKDDIQNHFRLEECDPTFNFPSGRRLITYEVVDPHATTNLITITAPQGGSSALFLWARALATTNRWQDVFVSSTDWPAATQVKIQTGPNIIELPHPILRGTTELTLASTDPLPSILMHELMGQTPTRLNLRDQETAASLNHGFDNITVEWSGYNKWWRDWGDRRNSRGKVRFRSNALFCATQGTSFRIPISKTDLSIELALRAHNKMQMSSNWITDTISYVLNNKQLQATTVIKKTSSTDSSLGDVNHYLTFTQKITIPAACFETGVEPDLIIQISSEELDDFWLRIDNMGFQLNDLTPGGVRGE
jgi:hypothetical protein